MPSRRHFLKTGLNLAAAMLSPNLSSANISARMGLHAGSGRADVQLAGLYPLAGFTGEHDPLSVRVVLLNNGEHRLALVVIDLTSLTVEFIARMKAIVTEIAGVPPRQAVVAASHTFSAPHISAETQPGSTQGDTTLYDILLAAFEAALRSAVKQAVATLQPARLGAGAGYSRIGVNRNVATPYGWWLGTDDAGFSDPHISVVRLEGHDGKPLAILMNGAIQPAIMDASQRVAGGRLVSADLAGSAARQVEAYYGGQAVAMYLVGAAGDQVPYLQACRHVIHKDGSVGRTDLHETGFTLVDQFGQRLGDEVIRVADSISSEMTTKLNLIRHNVTVTALEFSPRNAPSGPVRTFDYKVRGPAIMPFVLMEWEEVALVGVQPELSASIGAHIRAASPYRHTLVITMADGAAKYMPDAASYDKYTYEARSSPYARGAAEIAAEAIIRQLKQMKGFIS